MADVLRHPHDNRKDITLFVICMVVGLAGIIALKFFFYASQFWVSAFPCTVLIFYFIYVTATKRYQLRGDRAGDSVYYLGFLYTLLSLGLSLYQFVLAGMGPREIVGNLGIALSTTILGLMGRVVLTQLREDPIEMEESARMALAQAATEVRGELAHMVEDVAIFRRTTVQQIVQGTEELSRETNKALGENVAAFTASAKSVIERIEQVFADFGDNAKKLNKASGATIVALEKLIERVEAIEAPQSLISAKFDPLAERIGDIFKDFDARERQQQAAVDRLRSAFETSTDRVSKSMEDIGSLSAAIKSLSENFERQSAGMKSSAEAVQLLSEKVASTLSDAAERQVSTGGKLIEAMDDNLRKLIAATDEALKDLVKSQRQASDNMNGALQEASTGVASALKELESGTIGLTAHAKLQAEFAVAELKQRLEEIGAAAKQSVDRQSVAFEEAARRLEDLCAQVIQPMASASIREPAGSRGPHGV